MEPVAGLAPRRDERLMAEYREVLDTLEQSGVAVVEQQVR